MLEINGAQRGTIAVTNYKNVFRIGIVLTFVFTIYMLTPEMAVKTT